MLGSGRKSGNNISAALEQDEKKQQKDKRPTACCTSTQSLFSRYLSASTGRIHCLRAEYLSTTGHEYACTCMFTKTQSVELEQMSLISH